MAARHLSFVHLVMGKGGKERVVKCCTELGVKF